MNLPPGALVIFENKHGILVDSVECGDGTRYDVLVPGEGILSSMNAEPLIIKAADLCACCTHHRIWHSVGLRCGNACKCEKFVEA